MNVHASLAAWSTDWWPWFLNHLWQATLFGVVVIILVALLRRTSARTRYAVLLVALAKFAVPASFLATLADDVGLQPIHVLSDPQGVSEGRSVPLVAIARVASPIETAILPASVGVASG